jgi:hypothetical protein
MWLNKLTAEGAAWTRWLTGPSTGRCWIVPVFCAAVTTLLGTWGCGKSHQNTSPQREANPGSHRFSFHRLHRVERKSGRISDASRAQTRKPQGFGSTARRSRQRNIFPKLRLPGVSGKLFADSVPVALDIQIRKAPAAFSPPDMIASENLCNCTLFLESSLFEGRASRKLLADFCPAARAANCRSQPCNELRQPPSAQVTRKGTGGLD